MKFQAFHVNPGEKLKKKDVNNDLSNFMSVFPNVGSHLYYSAIKSPDPLGLAGLFEYICLCTISKKK